MANPFDQFDSAPAAAATPAAAPASNPFDAFDAPAASPAPEPAPAAPEPAPSAPAPMQGQTQEDAAPSVSPFPAPSAPQPQEPQTVPGEIQPSLTPYQQPLFPPPGAPAIQFHPENFPKVPAALLKHVAEHPFWKDPDIVKYLGGPVIPQGSQQAPQNVPDPSVQQFDPKMSPAKYFAGLSHNFQNDATNIARGLQALPNIAAERFLNETKPRAWGGMGRSILPDSEDAAGAQKLLGEGLKSFGDTYLFSDVRDLPKQLYNHPLQAGIDLAPGTIAAKGLKVSGKIAISADRAIQKGLVRTGGLAAKHAYKQGQVDLARHIAKLAKKYDIFDAADRILAMKILRNSFEKQGIKANEQMAKMIAEIDELGSHLNQNLLHRFMAGAEWTDVNMGRMLHIDQSAQRFLKAVDNWWNHILPHIDLTPDQLLVARYGPAMIAELKHTRDVGITMNHFYINGNPANGFKPEAIAELKVMKANMDAAGRVPHYFPILTAKQAQDSLARLGEPFGAPGVKEDLHFLQGRTGGLHEIPEPAGPTKPSPFEVPDPTQALSPTNSPRFSLRGSKNELNPITDAKAGLINGLRYRNTQIAIQEAINHPKFPDKYKGYVQATAAKELGVKLAQEFPEIPPGLIEQGFDFLGQNLKLPFEVNAFLKGMTSSTGSPSIWDRTVGATTRTWKKMLLSTDAMRLPVQFPQGGVFFSLGAIKSPQDLAIVFTSLVIATDKKASDAMMGLVGTTEKTPGLATVLRNEWNSADHAWKVLFTLIAADKLMDASLNLVGKGDDFWRRAHTAMLFQQEMRHLPAEARQMWDGAFQLSASGQENLGKMLADPEIAKNWLREVQLWHGRYDKNVTGIRKVFRDTIMFYPWLEHIGTITIMAPVEMPLKLPVLENIQRWMADAYQDKDAIPTPLYQSGAVVMRGPDGKPQMGPNGRTQVFVRANAMTPLAQSIQNARAAMSLINASIHGGMDPEAAVDQAELNGLSWNPFVQLAARTVLNVDPNTGDHPKDPRDIYVDDAATPKSLLERSLSSGPDHRDLKLTDTTRSPRPRLDATIGETVFPRQYRAWQQYYDGVPSHFTAPGIHAPKMEHMTHEEQAAKRAELAKQGKSATPNDLVKPRAPMWNNLAGYMTYQLFQKFYPTEVSMEKSDSDEIAKVVQQKAQKKFVYQAIPKKEPKKYEGYVRKDEEFDPAIP